jgi:hypothetical protein
MTQESEYIGYAITACILLSAWLWVAISAENAPLYDEDTDTYKYKDYFTIFGIKIKKRKNK